MRLSTVVPAYNAEQWLERCILSIEGQDVARDLYEVIIVNDGSTDGTLMVAQKLAAEFSNIRIVSQPNKGLSEARNAGIDLAKGDYLMFVDSDDMLARDCLGKILSACEGLNLDLLRIGAVGKEPAGTVRKGKDVLLGRVKVCAPFTVCRRAFLEEHGLRFFPGIFHEDAEFTPRLYFYAGRVASLGEDAYIVNRTPGSITSTPSPKRVFDLLLVMDRLHAFASGLPARDRRPFHDCIASNMNYTLHLARDIAAGTEQAGKQFSSALARHRRLFSHMCSSSRFRWKAEGVLFGLFPGKALAIYAFFSRFIKPDPDA